MREEEILPHVSPCELPPWACGPPLVRPTWRRPISCALTELDPKRAVTEAC
jgi:hypothetical protein